MKNQFGNLMVSLLLFLMTVAITINMTVDFFRLNRNVQSVTKQTQAKSLLTKDLERQSRIITSIRRSMADTSNTSLNSCILGTGTCVGFNEFTLASPMVGNPVVAGPESSPVAYTSLGERCPSPGPGCDNLAYAYFALDGSGNIKVWVTVSPISRSDPPAPTVVYQISRIIAPTPY